ncbi:MAG: UDP-glucose 4-epimerase GalE [Eubacteriales bacterium]|nr:UDP-glucose 4-epimerase GalE [Eubacteriales bacterium]
MKILVCGGAGYIGSHTILELLSADYEVVIADNFSNSCPEVIKRLEKISGTSIPYAEGDLDDQSFVDQLFEQYGPFEAVIHFAALKAVGESCLKPIEYYKNNLISTLNILDSMRKFGCHKIIYSSSATVYGEPEHLPIAESVGTSSATNPYGQSKIINERFLEDYAKADPEFIATALRYANPLGAHESGEIGEEPNGIPGNLVPYIAKVAVGKLDHLNIFGDDYPTPDGTGRRDYIHVVDLAKGHVAALAEMNTRKGFDAINLGTGRSYSVFEILNCYSEVCGRKLPYEIKARRPGDIAENYLDPTKAKEKLNWTAQYDLRRMLEDSWHWQSKNPDGYTSPADSK